jgi:hypothetical protein
MTIVNEDSNIIIKWSSKLIDAARCVIYDPHMFIIQATGVKTFIIDEKKYVEKVLLLSSRFTNVSWFLGVPVFGCNDKAKKFSVGPIQ